MGVLSAKISLLFAFVFGLLGIAGDYVLVETNNPTFNFRTGDNEPIVYYLNVKNIGSLKARFDVTSNASWISIFREGQRGVNSLEIPPEYAVNFVLEINANQVTDGVHAAEVLVNAINLDDYSVLDFEKVNIILNKNLAPTSVPSSPSSSPTLLTLTPIPVTIQIKSSASPVVTIKPGTTLKSTKAPLISVSQRPLPSKPILKSTPSKAPIKFIKLNSIPTEQKESVIKNIWQFFRGVLGSIF